MVCFLFLYCLGHWHRDNQCDPATKALYQANKVRRQTNAAFKQTPPQGKQGDYC